MRDPSPVGSYETNETVLTKFIDTLVDLSINEKSVHFLNTQEVQLSFLYEKFESFLLEENSKFIKKLLEVSYKFKSLVCVKDLQQKYFKIFESFPVRTIKEVK